MVQAEDLVVLFPPGFYTVLNSFHRRECQSQVGHLSSFYLFIYLAASGLGCVMWDLLLQGTDSLVVAHGLSCSVARGILVSPPGIKIHVSCIARRILNQWTTREIPGHNSSHCSFSSKCSQTSPSSDLKGLYNKHFPPHFNHRQTTVVTLLRLFVAFAKLKSKAVGLFSLGI